MHTEKKATRNKPKMTLKGYLVTGLLVWIPLAVTLMVVSFAINQLDGLIDLLPQDFRPRIMGHTIPGMGFVISILILLGTGVLAANVFGNRLITWGDRLLSRIPIIKSIYTSVKKVTDTLFSDSAQSFKTPIWVHFPHQDSWTLAFIAGEPSPQIRRELSEHKDDEWVSVYVPTTPNPTSGYFIIVRERDTRQSELTVDQALKYIISLGMVAPEDAVEKTHEHDQIELDLNPPENAGKHDQ